jgi:hypothetical protein
MISDMTFLHLGLLPLLLSGILLWLAAIAGYRAFFHPLAKIPGPRLARLTYFYLFYFNIGKTSRLYLQIEKLHEIYGEEAREHIA